MRSVRQPSFDAQREAPGTAIDLTTAWSLVLFLASRARAGRPVTTPLGLLYVRGTWVEAQTSRADVELDPDAPHQVHSDGGLPADVLTLFELYLPLVLGAPARSLVLGHLGQSLDGRVATPTGMSQFITGREDIVHTHRLRALFDAVLVGVRTVELDDPQLTTRLVPGEHPVRVVLDPHGKLQAGRKLLDDGVTPTLVCTTHDHLPAARTRGHVEWLPVPCGERGFDVVALLAQLAERGLSRVFVEGGGVTVSRFLSASVLDRLHVTVAPMILGSGAPAFALPPIDRLEEALTLRCRHFSLGRDLLFDCDLAPCAKAIAE